ncbi:MAG: phosphatidate cytidylyltransferase [Candidatus Woesearchaeota archaeon]|jgi:dolichol kinase|nr:phosphatidate cytidylyltransferase [Candidatus Woesearchaeota archaeon]MDP7622497.1 phosphatidate cytidylyltransferase [Candidatus Woesearchaeota archaeon]HJN56605.1 phosphatidate cytidylyltransferase [Candidatus Woesearchaeota archaeon]|tara:strand:+ start:314 stop:907 length:594 start_codon:yes stop_codon:yes gene_type:complete
MSWEFVNELSRKTIHITILIVLALFFAIKNQAGQQAALLFLVVLLLIFLILEYFRLELNFKLPFFHQFIRPKEQYRVYGVIFFLLSAIVALAVFDTAIALAALLMTTFGDMSAAIAGKKYGNTILFKNKTVVGFVAELITNFIVALIISLFFSINIYIPIIMAFVATITETLVDELDDNLVVPIASGFIGQILLLAF